MTKHQFDIGDFVYFVHRYPDDEEDDFTVLSGTIVSVGSEKNEAEYAISADHTIDDDSHLFSHIIEHRVFLDKWKAHARADYLNDC